MRNRTEAIITPHARPLPAWRGGGFIATVRLALGARHFDIDGARHTTEEGAEVEAIQSAHGCARALARDYGDRYTFRVVVSGLAVPVVAELLDELSRRALQPPAWLMRRGRQELDELARHE
jgi:hypothetical protein